MSDYTQGMPRPDLMPGDRVTSHFYPREADRIRVVESVTPAPNFSQSGWYVRTRCGLYADAAWFKRWAENTGPPLFPPP